MGDRSAMRWLLALGVVLCVGSVAALESEHDPLVTSLQEVEDELRLLQLDVAQGGAPKAADRKKAGGTKETAKPTKSAKKSKSKKAKVAKAKPRWQRRLIKRQKRR